MSHEPTGPSAPRGDIIRSTILRARLVWRLWWDRRVAWWLKLIPLGGLAYVFFPFDIIVDFLVVAGQADDLGILLGSLWLFVEMCPAEIVREHWDHLAGSVTGEWREVKPKELPGKTGDPGRDEAGEEQQ
jgi:uncharacterized membrane protein YkvA (DUF1232 family)